MRKNHVIDLNDLSKEQWEHVVALATRISKDPQAYSSYCKNKILATLFFEPSTRTQMSFQTAMLRLGGSIIGFDNPMNSSVSKGETLADTVHIVSGVCRHHCNASSGRRRRACCITVFPLSGHQCGRRRSPASDTDTHGSRYLIE